MIHDALTCPFNQYHMGITAENVAEKYGVSRHDQVLVLKHKEIFCSLPLGRFYCASLLRPFEAVTEIFTR